MRSKNMILLTFVSAIVVTACGNSDTSSTPQSQPAPASKPAPVTSSGSQTAPVKTVDRGQTLYKRCRTCHTLGQGEPHKVGPNLYGIFGATAGARDDFNYSKVMKESGVIWTDENIDAYIAKPAQFMPGNRMSFVGISKPEDREKLIAYMKSEILPDSE